ncbi:hypothetical protein [Nocardia sp. NPDC052112]|uniref:hypothetical protein n=1 Tax=Nocardia sp. NPDC052112 TaxID=3155646 RepID=UPI00343C970C
MELSTGIDWQNFTVDITMNGTIVANAEPDPGVLSWSGSAWYHVSSEDYAAEDYPDPRAFLGGKRRSRRTTRIWCGTSTTIVRGGACPDIAM